MLREKNVWQSMKFIVSLYLVLIFLLLLRFFLFFTSKKPYHVGQHMSYVYTFLDEPRVIPGNRMRFFVNSIEVISAWNENLHYGATIRLEGKVGKNTAGRLVVLDPKLTKVYTPYQEVLSLFYGFRT